MRASENLRRIGVINGWDLADKAGKAGLPDVWIGYTGATTGRGSRSAHWTVARPHHKTDPDGPWYNYGQKTFPVWGVAERGPKLNEALKWAEERYGIREWSQVPGLKWAYFPKEVAEWVRDRSKEAR